MTKDQLKKFIVELEEENKKLKEKNEKLEEDNINLISFNEHYSPDVIVKYEDRYETAYNEECIENAKLCDKMRRLEEENKKLKKERDLYKARNEELNENCFGLSKENKKLRLENADLMGERDGLKMVVEKLKEENQTLELWLDNKEKLNEEYRNKIDLLEYQSYGPSELADSLYDANKTIEKLKEELSKYKKQYEHSMGGDDELIYEEGLYD